MRNRIKNSVVVASSDAPRFNKDKKSLLKAGSLATPTKKEKKIVANKLTPRYSVVVGDFIWE